MSAADAVISYMGNSVVVWELAVHKLHETDEREAYKPTDRRKKRYYAAWYVSVQDYAGRDVAKRKVKRVTTECVGCNLQRRFCLDCFLKFHKSELVQFVK